MNISDLDNIKELLESGTKNIEDVKVLLKIFNKMCKYGNEVLGEICKVGCGIQTGCNKAFIIEDNRIFNDYEKKYIKPVIEGKNIERYNIGYSNKNIIYITKEYKEDKSKIPNIYSHLNKYIDDKSYIKSCKIKNNEFEGRKIVGKRDMNEKYELEFSIDENGFYSIDTVINIILNLDDVRLEYICGLLNSKLINTYYRFFSNVLIYNRKKVSLELLNTIPIPLDDMQDIQYISDTISSITKMNKKIIDFKQNISNIDKKIEDYNYPCIPSEPFYQKETTNFNIKEEEEKKIELNCKMKITENERDKEISNLNQRVYAIFKLDTKEIKKIEEYYKRFLKFQ